jgi:hypothetical protein
MLGYVLSYFRRIPFFYVRYDMMHSAGHSRGLCSGCAMGSPEMHWSGVGTMMASFLINEHP